MRTPCDWRSSQKINYKTFKKAHPTIKVEYDQWKNILYSFNDSFKEYILETGERAKLPYGIGEFTIRKKKCPKTVIAPNGVERISLPKDWKKTREKGKPIYNFNFHTEGYFFGWIWFKKTARFREAYLWYFKPCRSTSRILAHYLKTDEKYQHLYQAWTVNT